MRGKVQKSLNAGKTQRLETRIFYNALQILIKQETLEPASVKLIDS